jgi:hypothetical protein
MDFPTNRDIDISLIFMAIFPSPIRRRSQRAAKFKRPRGLISELDPHTSILTHQTPISRLSAFLATSTIKFYLGWAKQCPHKNEKNYFLSVVVVVNE